MKLILYTNPIPLCPCDTVNNIFTIMNFSLSDSLDVKVYKNKARGIANFRDNKVTNIFLYN